MMSMNESILVFEYFTASGQMDKSISSEAEALLYALLDDLADFKVSLLVNSAYSYIADKYDNVCPIIVDGCVEDYLKDNLDGFKKAIYIAAENDNHLYNIAQILEDKNVLIYNSSSGSCLKTSDKYLLYEEIYGVVPQPLSNKFKIDPKGYWKRAVENLYKQWHAEDPLNKLKLVIKPINGVDCENIVILEDIDELSYDLEKIFPPQSRILVQEYIEGEDVSVSLLVHNRKAVPLSINKQFIEIKNDQKCYLGGMLPYETEFKEEILKTAVKACEALEGLEGFVGVDLRVNHEDNDPYNVYLIEINSRFTTPYVGLQKISNINIAKTIIELADEKTTIDEIKNKLSLNGSVEFIKNNNELIIKEK